jgi:hypothetical protein
MANGKLGSVTVPALEDTVVYSVPVTVGFSIISINVCNRNSFDVFVNIAISENTTPVDKDYIEYNTLLKYSSSGKSSILERTGIYVNTGEKIIVHSTAANVLVRIHGVSNVNTAPVEPTPEYFTSVLYPSIFTDEVNLISSSINNNINSNSLIETPHDSMNFNSSEIISGTLEETIVYISNTLESDSMNFNSSEIISGTLEETIVYISNTLESDLMNLTSSEIISVEH